MDKRTEASRARALVGLVIERNRLREAIDDEEASLEMCKLLGIPPVQIAAAERRIALLRSELDELQPGRRPATPTTKGDTDG